MCVRVCPYAVFFLPNILCVHVRKLGTSVRKSTAKSDLQTCKIDFSAYRSRQAAHFSFKEEIYESKVTDGRVANLLHACDRY